VLLAVGGLVADAVVVLLGFGLVFFGRRRFFVRVLLRVELGTGAVACAVALEAGVASLLPSGWVTAASSGAIVPPSSFGLLVADALGVLVELSGAILRFWLLSQALSATNNAMNNAARYRLGVRKRWFMVGMPRYYGWRMPYGHSGGWIV